MGLFERIRKAERLEAILTKVGFSLWQLQELEGTTARYSVLVTQAKPGMGIETGEKLVELAQKKTFGRTIHALAEERLLPEELEKRFKAILKERNWLVHSSRASNRGAIHDDGVSMALLERLERIGDEALLLLKAINNLTENFVRKHGVTAAQIDVMTAEILAQWHRNDEL